MTRRLLLNLAIIVGIIGIVAVVRDKPGAVKADFVQRFPDLALVFNDNYDHNHCIAGAANRLRGVRDDYAMRAAQACDAAEHLSRTTSISYDDALQASLMVLGVR